MNESSLLTLAKDALTIGIYVAAPFLLMSLVLGSIISLVQAATQITEVTLTFVPKIFGGIVIIVLLGSWMLQQLITYTTNLFNSLPTLIP